MLRRSSLAAILACTVLAGLPASAQTPQAATPPRTTAPSAATAKPAPAAAPAAKAAREPTAGQMAARERQRKCGAEWKADKAAGKTGSMKWPQYWSQCNARLKGNSA